MADPEIPPLLWLVLETNDPPPPCTVPWLSIFYKDDEEILRIFQAEVSRCCTISRPPRKTRQMRPWAIPQRRQMRPWVTQQMHSHRRHGGSASFGTPSFDRGSACPPRPTRARWARLSEPFTNCAAPTASGRKNNINGGRCTTAVTVPCWLLISEMYTLDQV